MKLQFAMDTLTTDAALELAAAAAPSVDIIELGTPLIKAEGFRAITAIKEAHPDKIVFADLKTMDAGELEAGAGPIGELGAVQAQQSGDLRADDTGSQKRDAQATVVRHGVPSLMRRQAAARRRRLGRGGRPRSRRGR